MPPSRFNRTVWPDDGAHRELLELLDALHRRHGCRSLRDIGRAMHLSYTRVHDIVRGASLPVDEYQVRALVAALTGAGDAEQGRAADRAAELFVTARRARDELELPDPAASPRRGSGEDRADANGAVPTVGSPPRQRGGRRHGKLIVLGVAAALVAGMVVVAVFRPGYSGAAGAAANPGGAPASAVVLQDSFDTDELDPDKWRTPTRADLIRPGGGVLNLVATPADTTAGVNARLEPRAVDGFREISFVIGVPEVRRSGPGGGGLTLREADGRTHRVVFGPTGHDDLVVAALVCSRRECHQYDEYDPPGRYEHFAPEEHVPVRVVQSDGQLQFYVRDRLLAQGPPGDAPLAGFSIDLDGFRAEEWRITVDSLTVTR